jgi:hypothetical protein
MQKLTCAGLNSSPSLSLLGIGVYYLLCLKGKAYVIIDNYLFLHLKYKVSILYAYKIIIIIIVRSDPFHRITVLQ